MRASDNEGRAPVSFWKSREQKPTRDSEKAEQRRQNNRLSAAVSRKRKRQELASLQQEVPRLQDELHALRHEMPRLQDENAKLRAALLICNTALHASLSQPSSCESQPAVSLTSAPQPLPGTWEALATWADDRDCLNPRAASEWDETQEFLFPAIEDVISEKCEPAAIELCDACETPRFVNSSQASRDLSPDIFDQLLASKFGPGGAAASDTRHVHSVESHLSHAVTARPAYDSDDASIDSAATLKCDDETFFRMLDVFVLAKKPASNPESSHKTLVDGHGSEGAPGN